MNKCYECGKELKLWEGYRHPVLGKKELVCSKCFDILREDVENYRNYILRFIEKGEEKIIVDISKIKFKKLAKYFKKNV